MNWLSLLIGVLIGFIVEWFYGSRRPRGASTAESKLRSDLAAARSEAGRLGEELRARKEGERQARPGSAGSQDQKSENARLWGDLEAAQSEAARPGQRLRATAETERPAHEAELARLQARLAGQEDLERRLHECASSLEAERSVIETLRAELASARAARGGEIEERPAASTAPDPEAGATASAAAAAGDLMEALGTEAGEQAAGAAEDDLEIIEGIGPKIAALLGQHGIHSFAGLAAADVATLRTILQGAGPRFRMANPASWPEQAALAVTGRWEELKALQASLSAGVQDEQP